MADKVEYVKIPKAMFDNLEERSATLHKIQTEMTKHSAALRGFEIKAVVTSPPSGPHAAEILKAVKNVWDIAALYGDTSVVR